ncbi:PIR protein, partial [Plasmodium ovale]
DINVNTLPPYKFYEELKKDVNLDQWLQALNTIYYQSSSHEDYLKEFGAKLVRNYTDVFNKNTNISPTYRCRYLNYWMDLELKRYRSEKNINTVNSIIDTFIEEVWKALEGKYRYCKREKCFLDKELIEIKKELHDFCANRDALIINRKEYPIQKLNFWVSKMYKKFFDGDNCIKYKEISDNYDKDEGPLHISPICTLYDTHATFPFFGPRFDYSFLEYRIRSVENCKKAGELLNTHEAPSYAPITGDDVSSSQQWINTTITGLTLMGIFSILFILYKFTSLGFWVEKNIIKKYIIRTDQDEKKNELTETSFHSDSLYTGENEYHIAYISK